MLKDSKNSVKVLCWMKNRQFAVAFPVHGNKKKAAKENANLIDL